MACTARIMLDGNCHKNMNNYFQKIRTNYPNSSFGQSILKYDMHLKNDVIKNVKQKHNLNMGNY